MVEPVGYDKMWQKFENDVYQVVKQRLEGKFEVEWNHEIRGLKPDVLASLKCHGGSSCDEREPCLFPAFIFEAYCKFKIERDYFREKDKQMKKYGDVCDSVLVMPQGYEQRPYCKSKSGKYHIISFHYLPVFLKSIEDAAVFTSKEEMCGDVPECNAEHVYKHFELSLRSRVDRCPNCKSAVFPTSLIYCSKYKEHYYPDFLDCDVIEHGFTYTTYSECDGCGDHRLFQWNYDDCPASGIEYKFQCKKCGAIFDPETKEIVEDFETHFDLMTDSFSFYEEKSKRERARHNRPI